MNKEKIFIGIDVGKDGGIVALDNNQNIILKSCIPKVGDKVDYKALFELLYDFRDNDVVVAIEDVHSVHGASAKANFEFGVINGAEIMAVEITAFLYGFRYIMVQPKIWQKRIWNTRDVIYKPHKPNAKTDRKIVDTKKTSLMASKRLFPREKFLKTQRSSVPHDGMVDAALIALYLFFVFNTTE